MKHHRQEFVLFVSVFVGFFLYFIGWAFSSPVGSSADESRHLTSILCGETGGNPLCEQTGGQTLNVRIPTLVAEGLRCMEGRLDDAANCQVAVDALGFTEVRYPGYDNYPGGFYDALRFLVRGDLLQSVLLIRIFNGFLFSLLCASTIALSHSSRSFVSISIIAVMWSPVSFLVPSVNPSSWSITGGVILPVSLVSVFDAVKAERYRSAATAAFLATSAIAIMAVSRFDALLAVPIVFLVAMLCWQNRQPAKGTYSKRIRLFIVGSSAIIFVLLTALFRWLKIFDDPFEGPPRHHQTVLAHNLAELPHYLLGFVGADPWNVSAQQGMRVPQLSQLASVAAVLIVVVTAWHRHSARSKYVMSSALGLIVVAILALHQSALFYMPKLVQPRYFLPMLVGTLVAFVVSAPDSLPLRVMRWAIVLTFVGQALVLYQNFRRYVIGLREVGNDDLGCMACSMEDIGWWWSSLGLAPVAIWAISVVGLGAAMVAMYLSRQSSHRSSDVVEAGHQ